MKFIQITNDPQFAEKCVSAGIDRIMVDLETRGKAERQAHRDTLVSDHSPEDVASMAECMTTGELLVRVNPWHHGSIREVDQVVAGGANLIMLPMFRTANEVRLFVAAVDGRAGTCLLFETSSAVARIDDILACPGIDEVYVGLNDLHVEMRLDFMFELVSGGLVSLLAQRFADAGLPFGFGGVAPEGQGPVSPTCILGEHARLGSSRVILSRGFRKACESQGPAAVQKNLQREVTNLRLIVDHWLKADGSLLAGNRDSLHAQVQSALAAK